MWLFNNVSFFFLLWKVPKYVNIYMYFIATSSASSELDDADTAHDNDFKSNSYVYADCQSSFRGIFAGVLLIIMSVVFIILRFVGVDNQ